MTKPIIGMPCDADWTVRGFKNYFDDANAKAIIEAGGIPVALPPHQVELAETYVQMCDGFLFLGGPDIDPTLFGQEPLAEIGLTSMLKDQFEIRLCQAAFRQKKAIFGICRGAQIIALALEGKMYQDFPSQNEEAFLKHEQAAPIIYPTHHVKTTKDSLAQELLGENPYVNSHHHQTVSQPGPHLKVSGRASDSAVEVIESVENDLVLAVQWHPEFLYQTMAEEKKLFTNFIERVNKWR